jgi:hypothetical protein
VLGGPTASPELNQWLAELERQFPRPTSLEEEDFDEELE